MTMQQKTYDLAGLRLAIAIPSLTGYVPIDTSKAKMETAALLAQYGVPLDYLYLEGASIPNKARAELLHQFLHHTDGTHLMFIDDDISWSPADVARLLAFCTEFDCVVGPYCTKQDKPVFNYALHPDENGKRIQNERGLFRLVSAPGGFNCFTREGLERMVSEYDHLMYVPKNGPLAGQEVVDPFFMEIRHDSDGVPRLIGEDIVFFLRWNEAGLEAWLDPTINLDHIGKHRYRKSMMEELGIEMPPPAEDNEDDLRSMDPAEALPIDRSLIDSGLGRYGHAVWLKHDTFIGTSLKLYGEWAQAEIDVLLPLLSSGDTVIDVGANIGTHTLPFAFAVGREGKVIAFEPQPQINSLLQENVDLARASDVVDVRKELVGSNACSAAMPAIDCAISGNYGAIGVRTNHQHQAPTYLHEQVTIDKVCRDLGRDIRLIKVDTEGYEAEVLSGAEETIRRDRPVLFVENNTDRHGKEIIEKIEKVAADRYRIYWHIAPYFNENNWAGNPENVFAQYRPEVNMLAVPFELERYCCAEFNDRAGDHLIPHEEGFMSWRDPYQVWLERRQG